MRCHDSMNTKEKKYALVTGASSGIGWHISMELAARGYSIVAVSNQSEQLQQLKMELENNYNICVETICSDLSQPNAAEDIFEFCQQKNLLVEVLVNNAGMLIFGEVINVPVLKAKTILQLHMNTPAMLCRLFGEVMAQNKKGYMLNVSSMSAVMPYPTISLYGPTKTFLRQFSRAFRTEMKGTGVHVLCLMPGATATALYDDKKVNIGLAMRLGVMKKAEVVAKAGVVALFKKRKECVPGVINKLSMFLTRFVPDFLIALVHQKVRAKFFQQYFS